VRTFDTSFFEDRTIPIRTIKRFFDDGRATVDREWNHAVEIEKKSNTTAILPMPILPLAMSSPSTVTLLSRVGSRSS
jgi:hypothetical protein